MVYSLSEKTLQEIGILQMVSMLSDQILLVTTILHLDMLLELDSLLEIIISSSERTLHQASRVLVAINSTSETGSMEMEET